MTAGEIEVILKLRDEMTARMRAVLGQMSQAGTQFRRLGEQANKLGMDLLPLSTALTAGAVAALKFSSDFQSAMLKTVTIAGESEENLGAMSDAVREMSRHVGIGPTALAKALLVVESTGIKGSKALDILERSAKASAAGLGETTDIARAVTAAITAYGAENLSAAQATDILFAAVKAGGAEADQFSSELGRVIGTGSQIGITFDETAGFIATFTRLGISAAEATTALSGVMNTVLKPSQQAREQLDDLGMSVEGLRTAIRERGLTDALIELVEATRGNDDAIGEIVPNVRALAGVMGTAGAQADEMRQILDDVKNSTGTLDDAFEKMRKTTAFSWAQLLADLENVGGRIGDELAPALTDALAAAEPLIDWAIAAVKRFGELPQPVKTATIALLGITALSSPFLLLAGSILKAAGAILTLSGNAGAAVKPLRAMWAAATGPVGLSIGGLAVVNEASQATQKTLGLSGAQMKSMHGAVALAGGIGGGMALLVDSTRDLLARLDELGSGRGVAAKANAQITELGKGFDGVNRSLGVTVPTVAEAQRQIAEMEAAGKKGGGGVTELDEATKDLLDTLSGKTLVEDAKRAVDVVRMIGGVSKLTARELDSFAGELEGALTKMRAMGQTDTAAFDQLHTAWVRAQKQIETSLVSFSANLQDKGLTIGLAMLGPELAQKGKAHQTLLDIVQQSITDINRLIGTVPPLGENGKMPGEIDLDTVFKPPATAFEKEMKAAWGRVADSLGPTILQALTGGGNIGASLGALIANEIGHGIGKAIGGGAGQFFSAFIPFIGGLLSMIGPDAELRAMMARIDEALGEGTSARRPDEGIRAYFERIRQLDAQAREATDQVEAAQTEAERLLALQGEGLDLLAQAQDALARYGGSAPDALHPLIEELSKSKVLTDEMRAALDVLAGDPSWQAMQSIAEEYGIALEGLGHQFQQARLNDIAVQYATDFAFLMEQGADLNAVLAGMQDEVQTLINDALKFGTTVPENMRGLVEAMAAAGLLTDETGQALTDLSKLSFGARLEDPFDRVATILEEIRDLLAGSIPQALQQAGQAAEDFQKKLGGKMGPGGPSMPIIGDGSFLPGAGITFNISAWDGRSVEQWLQAGGDRQLARAVVPMLPDEVTRLLPA